MWTGLWRATQMDPQLAVVGQAVAGAVMAVLLVFKWSYVVLPEANGAAG